jgi:cell division protein FtsL
MNSFPTLITFLIVANFASGLSVAYVEHRNRDQHQALRELELLTDDLGSEWGRLLLAQSLLADPPRVERVALQQLGMVIPEQKDIVVIWP